MKPVDRKSGRERSLAWLFLIAGLLASTLVYWEGKRLVEQELEAQLDARSRDARHGLERQLDAYELVLRDMQNALMATPDPGLSAFRQGVGKLNLKQRLPSVQAVGFSQQIAAREREAFGNALVREYGRETGTRNGPFLHPSPAATTASVAIRYLEPLQPNRGALGFDQASEARRMEAIVRARDSGEWTASKRVRLLVQPASVDGVVFFAPVYRSGIIPATLEQRRKDFIGVAFVAVRIDEMLNDVFGPKLLDDLDISIHDENAPDTVSDGRTPTFIFGSNPDQAAPVERAFDLAPLMWREQKLSFGGNTWDLALAMRQEFLKRSQYWLPPLAAFAGVLMSFLAFFFMLSLNYARRASESRAREAAFNLHSKERQLEGILESIDEVFWSFDPTDGRVQYVSPAVERLHGYPAQVFYEDPKRWLECVHPDDRAYVAGLSSAVADLGWVALEYRMVRADGALRWMRYDAYYVPGVDPEDSRIDCVGRDITEQRQMEDALRRSNRALRAIHACDAEIAAAADEHALLQGICEVVVREGYRMAWSGLLNEDGSLSLGSIAGHEDGYLDYVEDAMRAGMREAGTIGTALRTQRPSLTNSFLNDPNMAPWREQAILRGFNAKIALPLTRDGSTIGLLSVYASEPDAFDADEVDLLNGLANATAVAINFLRYRRGQQAAEAAFRLRERAIEASTNAIIITSATQPGHPVEYVNPAFEQMTGYSASDIVGQSLRILHGDDADQPGLEELRKLIEAERAGHVTLRNYRKDGSLFWTDVHLAPVRDESGKTSHFVAAKYDVTTTKNYEAELEFRASRDTLTTLANRRLLHDRLEQAIAEAARYQAPVWVVFIDLDRFKFVNDTLGHQAGDELLKQVSGRLLGTVRHSDTVARLGGDEFVLVLSERGDEKIDTGVVQRIMDAIAPPFIVAGHDFFLSCSIGISVYPNDGEDAETLLKHADIAMYRAKELGRDNFQFYTSKLNERALERLRLEGDLRSALDRGEFVLHYQPQVDLSTGNIVGMEALVRWQHPELGMVPPGRFIALAEEIGLIVPIGEWVLDAACRQNRAWQQAGLGHLRVAVNLSARQFSERQLAGTIARVLEESGLDARYLDIELTETLVMTDVEFTIGVLRELKVLGVHLSIDDFGTGYSSLSYLKRFPIDVLKIDKSFVQDISGDRDAAEIVRSIISLAHSLRLQVIAEGVETEEQLAYLRRQGCDQMQGYYFSRPLSAASFEKLLRENKKLPALEHIAGTESGVA